MANEGDSGGGGGFGLGADASAGLSNADFARIFRQQTRATVDEDVAATSATTTESAPEEEPRGGLGAPAPPAKVPLPVSRAQLASLGQWEKHTKGFGMKMLAKMGFKGRLGKDERGVSATVEVVQRPALMGIGFGNFTEASALKHNRRLQRELRGETPEDETARLRQEADARDEDDALWRKRKAPLGGGGIAAGGKKKYKRAADVSFEARAHGGRRSDTVLDMRGPSVRVLASVSDALDADPQQLAAAQPKLGDELIYNVRMVVNQAQNQIYDLTSKVNQSSENLASLEKEEKIIKAQVAMEKVRLQHVEAMMQRMQELEKETDAALDSRDVAGIVARLSDVREAFPQEFEAYKLHQVVPSLCIPPLKARLTAVDFSDEDTRMSVVQQFRLLQIFLLEVPSGKSGSNGGGGVFHNIHEKVNSAGEDMYNFILEETLWPAVTQFVTYQWSVKASPEDCIAFLELFRPHLSADFEAAFLHQLVLSRLKKECQRWDPQTDTVPIHDWLLPWLPHLGGAMHSLYPDIRLTLSNALNQWHPSDLSLLAVLSPWRAVWGEHEYAKFTHRHVVRKLVRCLHRDFEINPQKQSLEALTWVLAWKEHLPERQFVALFEGEFFPKWLRVLRRWVATDSPSLLELERWYRGWKGFFDKQQLAQHHRLIVHFHGALVLLEAASDSFAQSDDDAKDAVVIPKLNRDAPSSYQDALVKARVEDPAAEDGDSSSNDDGGARAGEFAFASQQQQQAKKKKASSHAVGLKDVIENLAIAHDITFLPKGFHDGQQMYVFGAHHILIEQGVVFAERSKGSFEPVDIEQLL